MKWYADKIRKTTYLRRLPIMLVCAFTITYGVLYISLKIGEYGLFFGGAIIGGFWGEVWRSIFQKDSPLKKLYALNYFPYILVFIMICILFGVIIVRYPLT